jgi:hypothetical protein
MTLRKWAENVWLKSQPSLNSAPFYYMPKAICLKKSPGHYCAIQALTIILGENRKKKCFISGYLLKYEKYCGI